MTDKTREDFEAWVTKQGHAAGYGGDGVYDVWVVSRWWESWQAATQQSAARIAALEDEVLALRKDAEWQSIETAPKDGTMFLCWVTAERYGETDEGQQYTHDESQIDRGWWRTGDNEGYFDNACGQIGDMQYISHWKPLPPAPSAAMNKEGSRE